MIPFNSAYSVKTRVQVLTVPQPSMTKQSFKDESDINNILKRFLKTGVMDFAQKNEPRYGDTTGLEFTQAMQTVAAAKSLFAELPAHLRARFENEPAKFLDFVQDDNNREEARALGLLKPSAVAPELEATPLAAPLAAPGEHEHSEPLRAADGTFREHTRAEKRADAKAAAAKTNSPT